MNRDRTIWSGTHTSGLVALAAFPLVLTTSAVGVTLTSAGATTEQAPPPSPRSSAVHPDQPATGDSADTTRPAFSSGRPWLGDARAGDIPSAALGAYQRAAGILGKVKPGCGVSWQLLAAVGQVGSEHGQAGGGEPGADGVVRPAIVGPPLNGAGPRPTLKDTDGGRVDGDPGWDRAVGPMQLLPGMWQVAGVDGDGDGERSEQDLDDAALAAGVYLCATGPGLDDPERAAEALLSYNGSQEYAEQVLAVAEQYRGEDFAVAGRPGPQSIGPLLDHGTGTAAERDSERALGETAAGTAGSEQAPSQESRSAKKRGQPGPEASKPEEPSGGAEQDSGRAGGDTGGAADESGAADEGSGRTGDDTDGSTEGQQRPSGTADGSGEQQPQEPQEDATPPQDSPAEETPVPDEDVTAGEEPARDAAQGPTDERESRRGTPEHAGADDERRGRGRPVEPSEEADRPEEEEASAGEAEEPATATTTVTGVLSACGDAARDYCLDGELLDLSDAGETTTVGDLDGDGATMSVGEELAGLDGETVELVVVEGSEPLLVVTLDGVALRPA